MTAAAIVPSSRSIRTTIDSLVPKWVFHVPGATHLETVPIVVDGVMYVTQPNEVYAIDARSGRQIWEYHRVPARQKGPNRGVAVWNDKVYFTTPDAFLIALHAATGNVIWETKLAEANDGYWSPGAPLVVKGKVIAGIAPGDHGLNGFLDAYDAKTGERLWRYQSDSQARRARLRELGRRFLEVTPAAIHGSPAATIPS